MAMALQAPLPLAGALGDEIWLERGLNMSSKWAKHE